MEVSKKTDRDPLAGEGKGKKKAGLIGPGHVAIGVIVLWVLLILLILFSCSVEAATVELVWDEPTTNTDTSAITHNTGSQGDLTGYKAYYGSASRSYQTPVDMLRPDTCGTFPSAGFCKYTLTLPAGQYFFAVTAYNRAGNESIYSNEVSKYINTTPDAPILGSVTGVVTLKLEFK